MLGLTNAHMYNADKKGHLRIASALMLLVVAFFAMPPRFCLAILEVHHEKDKTVYQVRTSPEEENIRQRETEKEQEKALRILDNIILDVRGRHGKGQSHHR